MQSRPVSARLLATVAAHLSRILPCNAPNIRGVYGGTAAADTVNYYRDGSIGLKPPSRPPNHERSRVQQSRNLSITEPLYIGAFQRRLNYRSAFGVH